MKQMMLDGRRVTTLTRDDVYEALRNAIREKGGEVSECAVPCAFDKGVLVYVESPTEDDTTVIQSQTPWWRLVWR